MTGIRVLILFPHITMPGGALNYARKLAEELRASGATVGILTFQADMKKFPPIPGVETISLNGPLTSSLWYWLLLPLWQHRINQQILAWQPDVIVPQVFPSNWWGWLYKKKFPGTKLVWICQEPSAFIHSRPWIEALTPWWKRIIARVLQPFLSRIDLHLAQQCDAAIANSIYTAGTLEQTYGFPAAGIAMPGLDISAFSECLEPRSPEIITVARLTKFKRVDFLLEVFAELLKFYPELRYNIVGTGEEEHVLHEKAVQLGIQSRVLFHGSVNDETLAELNRRSCLFLHGARNEPFGMAPLEAIASGTPVVAHRSGGIQEFINERCGRLVDSSDPAVWGKLCVEFLDMILSSPGFHSDVHACAGQFEWNRTLKPALEIIAKVALSSKQVGKS
jgi:glycosyltransferase involved in cell wall biosynthesis